VRAAHQHNLLLLRPARLEARRHEHVRLHTLHHHAHLQPRHPHPHRPAVKENERPRAQVSRRQQAGVALQRAHPQPGPHAPARQRHVPGVRGPGGRRRLHVQEPGRGPSGPVHGRGAQPLQLHAQLLRLLSDEQQVPRGVLQARR